MLTTCTQVFRDAESCSVCTLSRISLSIIVTFFVCEASHPFLHVVLHVAKRASSVRSVEHAALIGGDHILNIYECILTAVDFKHFKGRLDQVSQVLALSLAVVDLVSKVDVLDLHQVKNGKDLAVVGDQGLADSIGASDESLENLQCDRNDLWIARVQCS